MKITRLVVCALALVSALFSPKNSSAYEERVFLPDDNTSQDKWFGNFYHQNSVNNGELRVGGWGDQYVTLIKFPYNVYIPGRAIIRKVYLHLYSFGSTRPTSMIKGPILQPWSEDSQSDHFGLTFYLGFRFGSVATTDLQSVFQHALALVLQKRHESRRARYRDSPFYLIQVIVEMILSSAIKLSGLPTILITSILFW